MSRPRGGYIGFNRVPAATGFNSAAVGVWTLREAEALRRAGTWPTAEGDPYFSNVSLLLHMDGSNGSTTFTDSSGTPKTVTASGGVISTAQSKFGGASGLFGANAYATIPINSDFEFGTGDFAVEAFIYLTSFTNARIVGIGQGANGGGPYTGWTLRIDSSTAGWYRYDGSTETNRGVSHSLAINAWHHIAVSRQSGTLNTFFNGTRVASVSDSVSYNRINSDSLEIGRVNFGGSQSFLNGYVDDLRITKGSARGYTGSTITVPTAPFPDGGPSTVPGAPTGLAATPGNAQLSLSWTAPASNGGAAITGYRIQYTPSGGSASTVDTGSATASYTLTGLTNGTSYTVSVAAINGVGAGSYSSTATGTPGGDPYFSNVSLLLHMDGTNGSTTFTDSSSTPKTILRGGSAAVSTASSRFGGASARLQNGDSLSIASSLGLSDSINWVVEFFIYPVSFSANDRLLVFENNSGVSQGLIFEGSDGLSWNNFGVSGTQGITFSLSLNQWQHLALARSGSTTRLYVNGALQSSTSTPLLPSNISRVSIGASLINYQAALINAYYDEWRVTAGSDRGYTGSTITVPTAPFPDGGA